MFIIIVVVVVVVVVVIVVVVFVVVVVIVTVVVIVVIIVIIVIIIALNALIIGTRKSEQRQLRLMPPHVPPVFLSRMQHLLAQGTFSIFCPRPRPLAKIQHHPDVLL
jgi:hypothetical protein